MPAALLLIAEEQEGGDDEGAESRPPERRRGTALSWRAEAPFSGPFSVPASRLPGFPSELEVVILGLWLVGVRQKKRGDLPLHSTAFPEQAPKVCARRKYWPQSPFGEELEESSEDIFGA